MTTCRYFALCTNDADGVVTTPIGAVPTCTRCAERMEQTFTWTTADLARARREVKRAVMVRYGGEVIGPALVGVTVEDADCVRWLEGATLEELMA